MDSELDVLLPGLPAISLDGPKGVGKTVTALQYIGTLGPNEEQIRFIESLLRAEHARTSDVLQFPDAPRVVRSRIRVPPPC